MPQTRRVPDCLDSNKKLKKSKCFIWCRLRARAFFLSLSCTEFVPNYPDKAQLLSIALIKTVKGKNTAERRAQLGLVVD